MLRKFALLIVIMTLALSTTPNAIQSAHSQEEDSSPPRIIDVWPAAGAVLLPSEPVMITFDQPMEQASVELAITITPPVPGRFAWLDSQTITFTPTMGWPRDAELKLTVSTQAAALSRVRLEQPASYSIHTVSGLKVARLSPTNADTVTGDTKIVVTFDRPVVPLTTAEQSENLPSPIAVQPAIKGKGRWINTALYVFTPEVALPGGTTYTVTVPAGLEASDGTTLDKAVTSTFSIQKPRLIHIAWKFDAPTQCQFDYAGLDCPVEVAFTEAMDQASTEAAFSLAVNTPGATPLTGKYTWAANDESFTFKPDKRLALDTEYRISVAASARNRARSSELEKGDSATFHTAPKPGIADISPHDGEQMDLGYPVTIDFRSLMKFSTVKDRITITPAPANLTIRNGNAQYGTYTDAEADQTDRVEVTFDQQPETTYTLTLKAGAEDIYGNAIAQDTVIHFSIAEPKVEVAAYPILNGTIMNTGAYDTQTHIDMLVSGKSTVKFTLYRLSTQAFNVSLSNFQFGNYCLGSDGTIDYNGRSLGIDEATLGSPLREWEQSFDETAPRLVKREVPLTGGKLQPGLYLIRTRGPGLLTEFVLAVASANLTVKTTEKDIFVWVTDLATAVPLADVPVTLYFRGNPIALGTTDKNGIVNRPLPDLTQYTPQHADPYFLDGDVQLYVVAQQRDRGIYGAWYNCNYTRQFPTKAYLYTDRPIYRPGETVYVKGILRNRQDVTFTPTSKKTAHVAVWTGYSRYDNKPFFEGDWPVNERGSFAGEFKLPDNVAIGEATIQIGTTEEIEAIDRDYYFSCICSDPH